VFAALGRTELTAYAPSTVLEEEQTDD